MDRRLSFISPLKGTQARTEMMQDLYAALSSTERYLLDIELDELLHGGGGSRRWPTSGPSTIAPAPSSSVDTTMSQSWVDVRPPPSHVLKPSNNINGHTATPMRELPARTSARASPLAASQSQRARFGGPLPEVRQYTGSNSPSRVSDPVQVPLLPISAQPPRKSLPSGVKNPFATSFPAASPVRHISSLTKPSNSPSSSFLASSTSATIGGATPLGTPSAFPDFVSAGRKSNAFYQASAPSKSLFSSSTSALGTNTPNDIGGRTSPTDMENADRDGNADVDMNSGTRAPQDGSERELGYSLFGGRLSTPASLRTSNGRRTTDLESSQRPPGGFDEDDLLEEGNGGGAETGREPEREGDRAREDNESTPLPPAAESPPKRPLRKTRAHANLNAMESVEGDEHHEAQLAKAKASTRRTTGNSRTQQQPDLRRSVPGAFLDENEDDEEEDEVAPLPAHVAPVHSTRTRRSRASVTPSDMSSDDDDGEGIPARRRSTRLSTAPAPAPKKKARTTRSSTTGGGTAKARKEKTSVSASGTGAKGAPTKRKR